MKHRAIILLMMLLLFSLTAEAQCAMCRAVLENEEKGAAAAGINNGIIYLMIFPYLLIAGVAYAIYRMRKKARDQEN